MKINSDESILISFDHFSQSFLPACWFRCRWISTQIGMSSHKEIIAGAATAAGARCSIFVHVMNEMASRTIRTIARWKNSKQRKRWKPKKPELYLYETFGNTRSCTSDVAIGLLILSFHEKTDIYHHIYTFRFQWKVDRVRFCNGWHMSVTGGSPVNWACCFSSDDDDDDDRRRILRERCVAVAAWDRREARVETREVMLTNRMMNKTNWNQHLALLDQSRKRRTALDYVAFSRTARKATECTELSASRKLRDEKRVYAGVCVENGDIIMRA